jgi:hypothetical protein
MGDKRLATNLIAGVMLLIEKIIEKGVENGDNWRK